MPTKYSSKELLWPCKESDHLYLLILKKRKIMLRHSGEMAKLDKSVEVLYGTSDCIVNQLILRLREVLVGWLERWQGMECSDAPYLQNLFRGGAAYVVYTRLFYLSVNRDKEEGHLGR